MATLIKKIIVFLSLTLFFSSFIYADSSNTTDTLTLKCYAKLGKGEEPTGMTIRYSAPEKKVTVSFVNQNNPNNLNHGQCTLGDQILEETKIDKFCQFNVDDVVYSKNIDSVNLVSSQAPYLIRILKSEGEFSLKVHKDQNACEQGVVVDSVVD